MASGWPLVVARSSRETPAVSGRTRKTPPPSGPWAGTRITSAIWAAGTKSLRPSSFQPAPSRVAVVGASSTNAAVRMHSPAATLGRISACCASVPNCASGSAPSTAVSM